MGTFNYSIDCPGCGPGASHANPGPLEFLITATGLTPEKFIANASGYTFSADIIGASGNTGSVGSFAGVNDPVSPVPEPASLVLFGTGLVFAGSVIRRRRS